LAWRRIVEGIIVEKLWKHLVNAAPGLEQQVHFSYFSTADVPALTSYNLSPAQ
jgi:hypothetical protein